MNTMNKALSSSQVARSTWTNLFLQMLSEINKGSISITTPEGEFFTYHGSHHGENVNLKIHDWKFCEELFMKGDIGLGESYIAGLWDCDDINSLIVFGIQNSAELEKVIKGSFFKILFYRLKHLLNRNSKKGSQKNIHAHYDIGNEFYKIWLDSSMTYSSAIFNRSDEALSSAQLNKYENIVKKLNLKPGDHILEVGCGWGGFMEYVASRGFRVTGITISKEQYEYALNRLSKYQDIARVELIDYRDIKGEFDHVVSIEMFEALGEQYWKTYFEKISSLLKPGGQIVIQSITINDQDFSSYRSGTDFIQQYIFPGGMLPSVKAFLKVSSAQGFIHKDNYEFGLDYAKTLELWEKSFSEAVENVKKIGFDEKFIRTWRFYLKYCQGGFEAKKISVFQFNLIKKQVD